MEKANTTLPELSNTDELQLRRYLLLPLVLSLLEREHNTLLNYHQLRLRKLSAKLLSLLMDAVTADLYRARQHLRTQRIRIIEEIENERGIACRYRHAGYIRDYALHRTLVRAELEVMLTDYLRRAHIQSEQSDVQPLST